MRYGVSLILLIIMFTGCKSTHYTPKNYKGDQLVVGTSGGVTGMMKEYVLLDNGKLFLSKGIDGDFREQMPMKRSQVREIFSRAEELNFPAHRFDHPGNLTYYLILKNPSRSYLVKWGESGVTPPEGFNEFYQYLMSHF